MSAALRSSVANASLAMRDFVGKHTRSIVRSLHRTPLARVLDSAPAHNLRERAFTVSPAEVLAILDACREAGWPADGALMLWSEG